VRIMLAIGIFIIICDKFFDWWVGRLDQKKGFWKTEQVINNSELNPFFTELDRKIDKIEEMLNNKINGDPNN